MTFRTSARVAAGCTAWCAWNVGWGVGPPITGPPDDQFVPFFACTLFRVALAPHGPTSGGSDGVRLGASYPRIVASTFSTSVGSGWGKRGGLGMVYLASP